MKTDTSAIVRCVGIWLELLFSLIKTGHTFLFMFDAVTYCSLISSSIVSIVSELTSFTFWSIIWPSGRIYFFLKLRLKQPPPQDYMAHHRGAYDKYSAGLSDKYNDKYSEGLAAKYNDKYAPRSSSSLMPASTDSMVGFMAKYK